jgi:hypothetical protein
METSQLSLSFKQLANDYVDIFIPRCFRCSLGLIFEAQMTGIRNNLLEPTHLIEWEPYKAACGSSFRKQEPLIPSKLIAYEISSDIPQKCRPDFLQFPQISENLIKNGDLQVRI